MKITYWTLVLFLVLQCPDVLAGTIICKDPLLAQRAQRIYNVVCQMFGTCSESFNVKLSVISSKEAKEKFPWYKTFSGTYSIDENIIYLADGRITDGVLAHELAHATITTYAVYSLTSRMQEILAGYAEFEVRKMNAIGSTR